MRFWSRSLVFWFSKSSSFFYLSPANLSYWWNFGSLSLYFLISQILTGMILAMFYNPEPLYAFSSIMYLTNEVYYGWWLRSIHSNGASFFFLCVYVHIFRGIYFNSFLFPRHLLWISGMTIFVFMIATAFLGYVLPWGQMSFWAAMVITSLLSSIPLIGHDLIFLLWGGFSICGATLYRFYVLHFFLPFVICALVFFHISFLHEFGSTNKIGVSYRYDNVPFTPYFVLKDLFGIIVLLILFFLVIFITPDLLGHHLNYEVANFMLTPSHIVPEWYLLFFYAILRSVPNKLGGLFLFILAIACLYLLPYTLKKSLTKSPLFKPWYTFLFGFFVLVCIQLSWIGGLPVMDPYVSFGRLFSFLYFFILMFLMPIQSILDHFVFKILKFEALKTKDNLYHFVFKCHIEVKSVIFFVTKIIMKLNKFV